MGDRITTAAKGNTPGSNYMARKLLDRPGGRGRIVGTVIATRAGPVHFMGRQYVVNNRLTLWRGRSKLGGMPGLCACHDV